MKFIYITIFSLFLISCEKTDRKLVESFCEDPGSKESRLIYVKIKKRNVSDSVFVGVYRNLETVDKKKRLLDVVITLDKSAALDIIKIIPWKDMDVAESKNILWGDRYENILFIQNKFDRNIKDEMDEDNYLALIRVLEMMKSSK